MDTLLNDIVVYLRSKATYLTDTHYENKSSTFYLSGKKTPLFMPGFTEVESFVALLPKLLADLEYETSHSHAKQNVYSPFKAKPSNKPSDFLYSEGQLIPKLWQRRVVEINVKPYQWLLGLLKHHLIPYIERTFKQVSAYEVEITSNRSGDSRFAKDDEKRLVAYFNRINRTLLMSKKTAHFIQSTITDKFLLGDSPPMPIPRSPAWSYAVELIRRWYKPELFISENITQLFSNSVEMESLPFLYQRYVGLRIVEALQMSGWINTTKNELIACFIGGAVEFKKEDDCMTLWCEPRLSKSHPSGFTSAHADLAFEQTPDYLLVKHNVNGDLDGYVIDATLISSRDTLLSKAKKYIDVGDRGIQQQKTVKVAGCKAIRKPLRSWIVSPNINQFGSQLLTSDGVFGVIPVNPRNYFSYSLDMFINDIN